MDHLSLLQLAVLTLLIIGLELWLLVTVHRWAIRRRTRRRLEHETRHYRPFGEPLVEAKRRAWR